MRSGPLIHFPSSFLVQWEQSTYLHARRPPLRTSNDLKGELKPWGLARSTHSKGVRFAAALARGGGVCEWSLSADTFRSSFQP